MKRAVFGALLLIGTASAASAEDKGSGPSMGDIDAACDAAGNVCIVSCNAAAYTDARREQCKSGCISAWDDCRASAAGKGGSPNRDVGGLPGKSVLDPGRPPPRGKPEAGMLPDAKLAQ